MPIINANDIEIFYEFEGSGPPLVFINGFASTHKSISDFIIPLKNHFKVLIFDNRGFGETTVAKPPYSIDMMSKDTIGLLKALKIENAFFVGSSMGSAILQKVCLDAPEMVKKAIFIGTFLELPYPCIMQMHLTKELLDKNIDKDLVLKLTMTFLYTSDFLKYENNIRKAVDNMKKIKINPNGYDGQVFALKSFNSSTWLDQLTHSHG